MLIPRRLAQHHLAARHRERLSRFTRLVDQVEDRFGHIFGAGAFAHRYLRHVEGAHVLDGLCSRYLAGMQVLQEKPVLGIAPQRPFVEVTGADGVHFDAERRQLEGERLREADTAEFAARIGEVGFRPPAGLTSELIIEDVAVISSQYLFCSFSPVTQAWGSQ